MGGVGGEGSRSDGWEGGGGVEKEGLVLLVVARFAEGDREREGAVLGEVVRGRGAPCPVCPPVGRPDAAAVYLTCLH